MLTQGESLTGAILAAIDTQPRIRLAILFGSLAVGRERVDSDLDLAIDAGRRITTDEKLVLITELAKRTGRPVDLVDLHVVGEPLLGQILRHGKRLLGGGTCYADLIRRHLFDQADYLPYRSRILPKGGGHGSGSNRAEARILASLSQRVVEKCPPDPATLGRDPDLQDIVTLNPPELCNCAWTLARTSLPTWRCCHQIRWAKPSMRWPALE